MAQNSFLTSGARGRSIISRRTGLGKKEGGGRMHLYSHDDGEGRKKTAGFQRARKEEQDISLNIKLEGEREGKRLILSIIIYQ